MMYSLEYKMMAQVLSQLKYSGRFQTEVSPRSTLKEGGHVILEVQQGKIVSCVIIDKSGEPIYENQEAQKRLSNFGVLEWKLMPTQPSPTTRHAPNTPPPPSIRNNAQIRSTSFTPPPQAARDSSPFLQNSYNTPPPQSEGDYLFYPRRVFIAENQIDAWPALEKSVYLLCDGQHSITEIARILSRSMLTIEQIVHTLQKSGALVNA